MIKKLRKIALGTIAVIALFATGPLVGQVWSQAANAQTGNAHMACPVGMHAVPAPGAPSGTVYQCEPVCPGVYTANGPTYRKC